jgi:hypothetical protein
VVPEKRLGSGPGGIEEVKAHPWFERIDWAALEARRLPAPIQPVLVDRFDTSNFDCFDDVEAEMMAHTLPPALPDGGKAGGGNQVVWELWDWVDTSAMNGK